MSKITITSLQILPYCSLLLLFLSHVNSQLYDQEHAILLKLKQEWHDPPLISHWTAASNSSHCTWPEITCTHNSISEISLFNMTINETIPPFICDLKNLTKLDLEYNRIPGQFPKVLYNCSKLEYLDLTRNYFVGPIPDDIDRLSRLRYLGLGSNNFSVIPASIGRLTELRSLELFQNEFNASFPPEIGNLYNLEVLTLAYNTKVVPSSFPSNFTELKKLTYLWMTATNLIGEIPETISNMVALECLEISRNTLTGKIPSSLFMLKNMSELYLFKNNFSGEIPQVVESLNLSVIDLSENNLTGTIPKDFGKLKKLSGLLLMTNKLSGKIPESIGRLPALADVRLFDNNLSGTLPPDFGRYSPLEGFEVSSNKLTGRLPEHLCARGKLVGVIAFDNNLSGELPKSLGNCNSLEIVKIYDNEFVGNIPAGMWKGLNLSQVLISDNKFTGELPEQVSPNLSRLEISNNRFSGKIPTGVSSWRNMVVFEASNNLFAGVIPRELTALPSLTTLSLDQNQLSGSLPSDIISWKSLTFLNLSRNQLSGEIPEAFGSLPGLTDLDLSENQFSGQIPPQIGQLKLTFLNLSSNRLTGEIPRQLENGAYADSFLNNPGLCAWISHPNLNSCSFKPRKSSKISSQGLALIVSSLIAVFLLALLFSLFVIRVYHKRKHGSDSKLETTSFQRLNFTESDILPKLTESNAIGSGGSGKVYRIHINHSGGVVAVKKIWNNRKLDQKHEKEFLSEVQILSRVRHVNIVKLLCCISNDNLKLLVYEYLENRSLDRWLHKRNRPSSLSGSVLDWPKRMQIAVGAAQGLCYMHHDCSPPIIHRDVKSSNVLLDSDFNAKIADFGLAKILIKQGELATMSSVAGSFGYIAPEYAHTTKVNEKIDIYSFGVILLELTTGREANYGDEHTCLAKWAWRHLQENNPIVDVLDEEINEPCYLDEMSRVFKLGIICTSMQPSARPSMKMVLQTLLNYPIITLKKNAESNYDVTPLLKNSKRERMIEDDDPSLASLV
ncbi:hypothetical protein LWI29_012472 [Acer saccharum]|uniref:Protein kinase domain-containing protein n=1 Tax=Acer saccharum TaxID=4024 RepID=A0AA39RCL9_ACESA|nr:hypothetical protein LWI29_012472 [Acer saccharum]